MSTLTDSRPPAAPGDSHDRNEADAREDVTWVHTSHVHEAVFAVAIVVIFLVNLFTTVDGGATNEWSAWWLFGWAW